MHKLRHLQLFILVATTAISASCGGGGGGNPPQNQPPTASFQLNTSTGALPLLVSFDASGSADPDGSVSSFEWDFNGDGSVDLTRSEPTAQFTYADAGTFTPRLRVVDNGGASATQTASVTVTGISFSAVVADPDGSPTAAASLAAAIVGGNPAVCYDQGGKLVYRRATDATGSAWGDPVVVSVTDAGRAQLSVVDGRPAILYSVTLTGDVLYARATDAEGAAWGDPVPVFTGALPGIANHAELVIADGIPVAYALIQEVENQQQIANFFFCLANDAQGSSWNPSVGQVRNPANFQRLRAITLGDRPALLYELDNELLIRRSENAGGTDWDAEPVVFGSGDDVSGDLSTAILDGRLAVTYEVDGSLAFAHAADADATTWNPVRTLVSNVEAEINDPRLVVSGGRPAVTFDNDTTDELQVIFGADAAGSAFSGRQVVDSASAKNNVPLDLGNRIGIAYMLSTDPFAVKFAAAQ